MPDIQSTILTILAEITTLDRAQIFPAATLDEDLGLNSLDMVELLMEIEDRLNVALDDDATAELRTVDELVRYVEKLVMEVK